MRSDGQKSLRDYFLSGKETSVSSPSSRGSLPLSSPSGGKRTHSDDEVEDSPTTPAAKKTSASKHVVIIDSDTDDENIFEQTPVYRNNLLCNPLAKNVYRGPSRQQTSPAACRSATTRSRRGRWSCSECTYSNHPLMTYCEVCCMKRDSPLSQPACSSTVSSELIPSDPVHSSSPEMHHSASDSCAEVVSHLSCQHRADSGLSSLASSQHSQVQLPGSGVETDADEWSKHTLPSDVCDTSLLKTLNIDTDQSPGADHRSSSDADEMFVTEAVAESSLQLNVDFSKTTVHELFQFCCSRNSSRIYIYDKVSVTFIHISKNCCCCCWLLFNSSIFQEITARPSKVFTIGDRWIQNFFRLRS